MIIIANPVLVDLKYVHIWHDSKEVRRIGWFIGVVLDQDIIVGKKWTTGSLLLSTIVN